MSLGFFIIYKKFTAFIILIDSFGLYDFKHWMNDHSNIILYIDSLNQNHIYGLNLVETINE